VLWSPGQCPLDLAILLFVAYPEPHSSYELLGDRQRAVDFGRAAAARRAAFSTARRCRATSMTSEPSDVTTGTAGRRGPLRRLYDWVLSWADSQYGTAGLAAISFAESSFFPIPPDVLQIALSVARPTRSFLYAAVSTVASVAGGILGWAIGWGLWQGVAAWFFAYVPGFSEAKFEYVQSLYQSNAFLAIFAAAFTPIPYKVFTIAAGVCSVPLGSLVVASALGRGARFFLVATATYFFGAAAKRFLDRYLELITLLLLVAIVAGFLALRFLLPG
jgi:membrane protein YqaA with SNARE-associated domain